MMKDMEGLHKAEIALEDLQVQYKLLICSYLPVTHSCLIIFLINLLQKELERARMEQENATTAKKNLEKRLQDETSGLHTSYSDLEVSQLKSEIEVNIIINEKKKF